PRGLAGARPRADRDPAPASGSSPLATTVNLPANATVTFSFTVQVDPSATGSLANTVTVTPPGGTPVSVTDADTLTPMVDLQVTISDGKTSVVPGTSDTYTIVVTNNGLSTAVAAAVTDVFPVAITAAFWTAVASPGSSVAAATGTGNIATTVTLLPGGNATYTAVAQISPSATGLITNTATVSPPARVTDTNPANNSATDTGTLTPIVDLQVTISDGKTSVVPGTSDTYTIVVTNNGPSTAVAAAVTDVFPAAITARADEAEDSLILRNRQQLPVGAQRSPRRSKIESEGENFVEKRTCRCRPTSPPRTPLARPHPSGHYTT